MLKIIAMQANGKTRHLAIQGWQIILSCGLFCLFLLGIAALGFKVGMSLFGASLVNEETVREWQGRLNDQQVTLEGLRETSDARVAGLTAKIGEMQADIFGLQDLSQRLAKIARVDLNSLEFSKKTKTADAAPAQCIKPLLSQDLTTQIDKLSRELDHRSSQLAVLESLLVHSDLDYDTYMLGRPIEVGYISSYYGQRSDPFHGKTAFHKGIDFAGEEGAKIFAMAAGMVTFAGEYLGYGNFVEIDHGNGYTTRYAHNKKLRVKMGDRVEKGQVIAEMGTSGRSTGPHLHLEVMKNGHHLNPLRYVMR